jgi:hypothetical protein
MSVDLARRAIVYSLLDVIPPEDLPIGVRRLCDLVQQQGHKAADFHAALADLEREDLVWRRLVGSGSSTPFLWDAVEPTPRLIRQFNDNRDPAGEGQPPLTPTEQAVLKIIRAQPKGKGIIGKDIIKALRSEGMELKEATLRGHVLSKLRRHFGVINVPSAGGYLIDAGM